MYIGEPKRIVIVEPIELPVGAPEHEEDPIYEPLTPEPFEPVPSGK